MGWRGRGCGCGCGCGCGGRGRGRGRARASLGHLARLGTAVSSRVVQLLDEPLEAGGLGVEPRRRLLAPPLLRQPILHVLITHDPEQALWVARPAVRLPVTLLPMHDLRAVLDGEPTGDLPLGDLADFLAGTMVRISAQARRGRGRGGRGGGRGGRGWVCGHYSSRAT